MAKIPKEKTPATKTKVMKSRNGDKDYMHIQNSHLLCSKVCKWDVTLQEE